MLGYTHYSKQGYKILVPLVTSFGYDFLVDFNNGTFLRVNVKLAGLKDKKDTNGWAISKTGSQDGIDISSYCDIYLVWLPHKKEFIELPSDFFNDVKSKSKRIPKKYL